MAMGNAYYYYACNILEGQVQYIMHNTKNIYFGVHSESYYVRSRVVCILRVLVVGIILYFFSHILLESTLRQSNIM